MFELDWLELYTRGVFMSLPSIGSSISKVTGEQVTIEEKSVPNFSSAINTKGVDKSPIFPVYYKEDAGDLTLRILKKRDKFKEKLDPFEDTTQEGISIVYTFAKNHTAQRAEIAYE